MRKGYKDLIAEAEAKIETISPDAAKTLLSREDVEFVDFCDPREREGLVPGAFSCARGMLEFRIDPESPFYKPAFASGKKLVFFCGGTLAPTPSMRISLLDVRRPRLLHDERRIGFDEQDVRHCRDAFVFLQLDQRVDVAG